jgi:nucleoside-diphosphate-sugar epimerase
MREFKPTHLVHLAAVTDQNGRSMADYASNTDGLRRVLEAATQYGGLQRSVFASTGWCARWASCPCPTTTTSAELLRAPAR